MTYARIQPGKRVNRILNAAWGLLACVLCVGGCTPSSTLSFELGDLENASRTPGFHQEVFTLSDGRDVPVFTSMPAVAETSVRPLIIVLHGGGPVTVWRGQALVQSLFAPGLESLSPIIVAPDLPLTPAPAWAHPDGKELVANLLDAAKRAWPIHPDRVVVAGYSAGGIGTWYMLSERLDGLSAGIAVAADPLGGDGAESIRTPIMHIHGSTDAMFPLDAVRAEIESLSAAGVPVTLRETDGAGHADVSAYVPAMRDAAAWLAGSWE